ncbi:MAG: IPT/TIG domain-containing protein [Acidobacteria bacterium]|nr:IPT/TIG domain-containing protein [Acidobacteriota bacterium]MBI3426386.1 IPT/TIG domain-containing protein [Acidobacteriota bacterium]
MRRLLLIIMLGCGSLLGTGASFPARLQSLTVKNFLNPDAPLVRESLVLVEGTNFTNLEENDPFGTPTTLAGVQVLADGIPQRIRSAAPTRVVFILDAAGLPTRALELRPKTGTPLTTQITLVNAWPAVVVQSTGEDSEAFIPSGLFTNDPGQTFLRPLTSDPIPVALARETLVLINGSGWRFAANVSVRLNGTPCKVVKVGPSGLFPGQDELAFLVPPILANYGPVDVVVTVAGREANYARLVLGRE